METKICQSCSMPIADENMYGKNEDGTKNDDYCIYCYPNGKFNSPNETMDEMIETCIPHCIKAGIYTDEETARTKMNEFFPTLKR